MPKGHSYKKPMYKPQDENVRFQHIHVFQTMSDVADCHQHLITGTSGPPISKGRSHVHRICVMTSYDPKGGRSHWHQVDIMTGPALEVDCCDEHTHSFLGETSFDDGHCHDFCSVTDASPEEMCYEEEEEEYCHCSRPDEE